MKKGFSPGSDRLSVVPSGGELYEGLYIPDELPVIAVRGPVVAPDSSVAP